MNILDFGESDLLAEKTYLELDDNINKIKNNIPWIEKYRPTNFNDIKIVNDKKNGIKIGEDIDSATVELDNHSSD